MALKVTDAGALLLLNYLLNLDSYTINDSAWEVRLYQNDYTPVAGSIESDFEECDFIGYSFPTVNWSEWTDAATVGGRAVSGWTSNPYSYTSTDATPQQAFGYYVIDTGDRTCIWAERFGNPRTVEIGNPLLLNIQLTFKSEF